MVSNMSDVLPLELLPFLVLHSVGNDGTWQPKPQLYFMPSLIFLTSITIGVLVTSHWMTVDVSHLVHLPVWPVLYPHHSYSLQCGMCNLSKCPPDLLGRNLQTNIAWHMRLSSTMVPLPSDSHLGLCPCPPPAASTGPFTQHLPGLSSSVLKDWEYNIPPPKSHMHGPAARWLYVPQD